MCFKTGTKELCSISFAGVACACLNEAVVALEREKKDVSF